MNLDISTSNAEETLKELADRIKTIASTVGRKSARISISLTVREDKK